MYKIMCFSNALSLVPADRKSIYPPGSGNEVPMETKSGQWLGATLKSNNGTVMVGGYRGTGVLTLIFG